MSKERYEYATWADYNEAQKPKKVEPKKPTPKKKEKESK